MRGTERPLQQVVGPRTPDGRPAPAPPDVAERLRAQQLTHLEESVRYCRDVLGIGMLNAVPHHIRFQPLASFDNYLVVPRNHPLAGRESVSLEEVARWPLVAPVEQGSLWRTIHRQLARRELQPRVVMRVASTLARLRYVEAGLGVTITSVSDVPADLVRALVWLSLSDELPRTAFGLITRANSYLSLPAKRFAEFVAETLPDVLAARADAAGVPVTPRVTP
jgi:DNA-binding transcriptional LysR family regulator